MRRNRLGQDYPDPQDVSGIGPGRTGHDRLHPAASDRRAFGCRTGGFELKGQLGGLVGYKVRFTDKVRHDTRIKFMTDGILLAESQGDSLLSGYSCLVIDEAHERSLNIDFILGYLRQLVLRRPELKVVITSATIDAQKFSAHFSHAPVLEVSGRMYPVEIRWRPVEREEPLYPCLQRVSCGESGEEDQGRN